MPSPRLLCVNHLMTIPATAYPWHVRVVAAALLLVSRMSLLVLGVLAFVSANPITPGVLLRAFWILCFAPELAVLIVRLLFATRVSIDGDGIVIELRSRRVEIPLSAVDAILPWTVPLPAPGFWLRLRSGARFSDGLATSDPDALLTALNDAGANALVDCAVEHPAVLDARSKHRATSRFDHPFFKFVVFSLVPTLPLFRLRQLLVYGGVFGEYYQFGLKTYLLGFGIHWVLYAIYLLLYAAWLRTLTEAVSVLAAWVVPGYAPGVRRTAEIAHRVLYFGGVPTFLLLRFLPW